MYKIINLPCNSWKPRNSSCLMKRRKIELLWEAGVVVVWRVPEQPGMLECPLTISYPWSPHYTWGCCQWRGEEESGKRGHRGWRRVRDHLCGWTSINCWWMRIRERHFWGSSRESWSHFRDRGCIGYGWTNDLLVFKLNIQKILFRISHWPVVPSVKLVFLCGQISKSWLRHRVVFWCMILPENLSDSQFVAVVNSLLPAGNLKFRSISSRRLSPDGFPKSSVGGCGWELVLMSPNCPGSVYSVYL